MITVNFRGTEYSVGKLAIGVSVVLTLLAGTITKGDTVIGAMPRVLWKTQLGHTTELEAQNVYMAGEITRLESMINDGIGTTGEAVDNFRNEWKCDEYREELDELLEKVDDGTATARDRDRITVLRQKMGPVSDGGLNCAQWED